MTQIQTLYYLQNAGSRNMAVDGTVQKIFDLSHETFRSRNIFSMELYIESPSSLRRYENFWNLNSALLNGMTFTVTSQEKTFQAEPLNTTRDLLQLFETASIVDRTIDPTKQILRARFAVGNGGLVLNENNVFEASVDDDLTNVGFISIGLKAITLT